MALPCPAQSDKIWHIHSGNHFDGCCSQRYNHGHNLDSAVRVLSMIMTINTHSKHTQLLITALVKHKTVRNCSHQLKNHYINSICVQYSTTKQLNEGIDVDKIDSSSMYSRQRTHSFKTARLLQYLTMGPVPYSPI